MALARWHTGTKAQTLMFLREASQHFRDIPDLMSEIEDEHNIKEWDVCIMKCRICGARYVAIVPTIMDNDGNECANCRNMTANVIDDNEE